MNYIDLHTHGQANDPDTLSIQVIPLDFKELPKAPFCYGIHPWDADKIALKNIFEHLSLPCTKENFFALGEIGLDKFSSVDFDTQKQVLAEQLRFATLNNIPRIQLHLLRSDEDFFKILKESKYQGKLILHGFNGNKQRINHFLKFDVVFSIGSLLMKSSKIQKHLVDIPIDRLFFETDDQKSYNISDIYDGASKILNIVPKKLTRQIKYNFKYHFTN